MIQVSLNDHHISVTGHAVTGAPPGHNIVCAAVSALTLTLIEGLESVAGVRISTTEEPGNVQITWGELNPIGKALIDTWYAGISQIQTDYGHITIA